MKETVLHSPDYSLGKSPSVSLERGEQYLKLIDKAKEGKAYPYQSEYKVRASAVASDGKMAAGGNKEFAHSNAFIHGETSAVDGLRQMTDSPIEAVAWYSEKSHGPLTSDFARPCGNCRDVLQDYCSPETQFLTATPKGVILAKFSDFLFSNYERASRPSVSNRQINMAIAAARGGNDVYLPKRLKPAVYGALLISESGWTWPGGLYTNAGYHAVDPVMSAVMNWENNYPKGKIDEKRLRLSKLLVVGQSQTPEVFYSGRQALLELDEKLRKFTKDPKPLDVELIDIGELYDWNNSPRGVYKTNAEEWLPHPFTPGAFRWDDVITQELGKLIGPENLKKLNL